VFDPLERIKRLAIFCIFVLISPHREMQMNIKQKFFIITLLYNRGATYFLSGNMGRAISDFQKACDMGDEGGCKALQMALKNR
jgi:hypothetical protein